MRIQTSTLRAAVIAMCVGHSLGCIDHPQPLPPSPQSVRAPEPARAEATPPADENVEPKKPEAAPAPSAPPSSPSSAILGEEYAKKMLRRVGGGIRTCMDRHAKRPVTAFQMEYSITTDGHVRDVQLDIRWDANEDEASKEPVRACLTEAISSFVYNSPPRERVQVRYPVRLEYM